MYNLRCEFKIMKQNKNEYQEILIEFNNTKDAKELDCMITEFEKDLNNLNQHYYLKESENPYIYFLEYNNPTQLIQQIEFQPSYNDISTIIPVKCVYSNINHITTTILEKMRYKIIPSETFNVKCFLDSYSIEYTEEQLKHEIINRINKSVGLESSPTEPNWNIEIHIIGSTTGINIKRTNKKSKLYYYTENT